MPVEMQRLSRSYVNAEYSVCQTTRCHQYTIYEFSLLSVRELKISQALLLLVLWGFNNSSRQQ